MFSQIFTDNLAEDNFSKLERIEYFEWLGFVNHESFRIYKLKFIYTSSAVGLFAGVKFNILLTKSDEELDMWSGKL